MRTWMTGLIGCALSWSLAGCHSADAPTRTADAPPGSAANAEARRFMAYERSIWVEVEPGEVRGLHERVTTACESAAAADECVILNASLSEDDGSGSASIQLRAAPEAVRRISDLLAHEGTIERKALRAEDLAEPIGDAERRLKMLQDYRTQLEQLRTQATREVDALIRVTRELSEVQSQIEALSGQQAHLHKRVRTDVLNIHIGSVGTKSFWRPIATAAEDFRHDFSSAVASFITAMAYVLPWALFLAVAWWVVRRLRARARRKAQG